MIIVTFSGELPQDGEGKGVNLKKKWRYNQYAKAIIS